MNPAEAEFRRVEATLDRLVEEAERELRAVGIHAADESARTYHYDVLLTWSYAFTKEWLVGVEKARVTVHLDYTEPVRLGAIPEIRLTWRAELFQQSKESRIDERDERRLPLPDPEQGGVSGLVTEAVEAGAKCLPPPSRR